MQSVSVGKAKITVEVRGCVDCGTEHAEGWTDAQTLQVTVAGRKPLEVTVSRCAGCARRKGRR